MRLLKGADLVDFIKQRQLSQVRNLRQAHGVYPHLAIIRVVDDPVIDTYMRLKRNYGKDILVEVTVYREEQNKALSLIKQLNSDTSVHGIIVQLPLSDPQQTDEICDAVYPEKDIDGLGKDTLFEPATPMAISWLLAGYNIELAGKKITLVGGGKLVGLPLAKMWLASGYDVKVLDKDTFEPSLLKSSDVIVTATGVPGLVTSDMLSIGCVVVDAGTTSEQGTIVGDIASDVYERNDLTITPVKGGVGPLTVTALFDNLIRAAAKAASK